MNRDPLDELRAANPVGHEKGAVDTPDGQQLLADIAGRPPRRSRGRRLLLVAAVVFLLLAATGTIWAVSSTSDPRIEIVCYGQTLDQETVLAWNGVDPVESCVAGAWAEGVFGPTPTFPTGEPALVACVDGSDQVAVVVTDIGCASAGLAPYVIGIDEADAFRSVQTVLIEMLGPESCVSRTEAEGLLRDVLDRVGLTSWSVEIDTQSFSAEKPCASVSIDLEGSTLEVVGRILPPE